MAEGVYSLCALTSIVCAALLLRGYVRSRTPLLFWSSLCFVGLALNNVLLVVDLIAMPAADLSVLRSGVAVVAMGVLLYGLVWERQ